MSSKVKLVKSEERDIKLNVKSTENVTKEIKVPTCSHGAIIGKNGENIAKIRNKFPGIKISLYCMKSQLVITGTQREVNLVAQIISNETFKRHEKHVDIPIDEKYTGIIIGRKGSTINKIKQSTNAELFLNANGILHIHGTIEAVAAAEKNIKNVMKSHESNDCINLDEACFKYFTWNNGDKLQKKLNEVKITLDEKNKAINIKGLDRQVESAYQEIKEIVLNYMYLDINVDTKSLKKIMAKDGIVIKQWQSKMGITININNVISIVGNKEGVLHIKDKIDEICYGHIIEKSFTVTDDFYYIINEVKPSLINSVLKAYPSEIEVILAVGKNQNKKYTLRGCNNHVISAIEDFKLLIEQYKNKVVDKVFLDDDVLLQLNQEKDHSMLEKVGNETGTEIILELNNKTPLVIIGETSYIAEAKEKLISFLTSY